MIFVLTLFAQVTVLLPLEDVPQIFQDFQVFRFKGRETRERRGKSQTICFLVVFIPSRKYKISCNYLPLILLVLKWDNARSNRYRHLMKIWWRFEQAENEGSRSREGMIKEPRMKDQGAKNQGALQAFVVLILVLCRQAEGGGPLLAAWAEQKQQQCFCWAWIWS